MAGSAPRRFGLPIVAGTWAFAKPEARVRHRDGRRSGRSTATTIRRRERQRLGKTFHTHFRLENREDGDVLLLRAIGDGDVRSGIDFDAALDFVHAPFKSVTRTAFRRT